MSDMYRVMCFHWKDHLTQSLIIDFQCQPAHATAHVLPTDLVHATDYICFHDKLDGIPVEVHVNRPTFSLAFPLRGVDKGYDEILALVNDVVHEMRLPLEDPVIRRRS